MIRIKIRPILAGAGLLVLLAQVAGLSRPGGQEAHDALRKGEFDRAIELFSKEAEAASDAKERGAAQFYLGLTWQRKAASPGLAPAQAVEASKRAVEWYLKARDSRGPTGSILNNLAQAQDRAGDGTSAAATFRQALELKDPQLSLFVKNYGDFILAHGDWKAATLTYARAFSLEPEYEAAHAAYVDVLVRNDPNELIDYLWRLEDRGRHGRAMRTALRVLTGELGKGDHAEELLTIAVQGLSWQDHLPDDIKSLPLSAPWGALANVERVAPAWKEIQKLHLDAKLAPEQFSWWRRRFPRIEPPPRGVWPGEAFVRLARSLGRRMSGDQNLPRAEEYYRFAIEIYDERPDPDAIVDLVEHLARTKQSDQIGPLLARYERRLFNQKGEAIMGARAERIYRFHRALGLVYAHLDRWDPERVDSAVYQLNHAIQAALRFNQESAQAGVPNRIVLEPRVVDQLASRYESGLNARTGFALRMKVAEDYLRLENASGAKTLLQPVKESTLDEKGRTDLKALHVRIETTIKARPPFQPDHSSKTIVPPHKPDR